MTRSKLFFAALLAVLILGLAASFATRTLWFQHDDRQPLALGLVAPLSGSDAVIGEAIRQGAQLYLDEFNARNGLSGRRIELALIDEAHQDASEQIRQQMSRDRVAAVIGHWYRDLLLTSSDHYQQAKLPIISLSSSDAELVAERHWLWSSMADTAQQGRFIANYLRNIQGERLVTLIHGDDDYGTTLAHHFSETYARFGTRVHTTLPFATATDNSAIDATIAPIIDTISQRKDLGVIFLAARPVHAAHWVAALRRAGVRNRIVGSDTMATHAFLATLQHHLSPSEIAEQLNSTLLSTPMLFDTADASSQQFRNRYQQRYGHFPDWIAAHAYDAARLILDGIVRDNPQGNRSQAENSTAIAADLATLNRQSSARHGVSGELWFNAQRLAQRVIQVGLYDGATLIAALTQLQPIREGSSANYIEELKAGKMLYVNDRFMYRTNVVYAGIELHHLHGIDRNDNTFEASFSIWFRYRGNFDPADITFPAAVTPIAMPATPSERLEQRNLTFVRYDLRGSFYLNALETRRAYGNEVIGIAFRHQRLNRNNVIYVVDLLGLGLTEGSISQRERMLQRKVLPDHLGWRIDDAWISQEIVTTPTLGDPTYVGHGAVDAAFSRIANGTLLAPAGFNFRDLISPEYFIYIALFGLIGSLFAISIDTITHRSALGFGISWPLRIIFWPITLLAAGNLLLDSAINLHLPERYIDALLLGYHILWWILPARLLAMAVEHLIWRPLERRSGRIIPNIIRLFASAFIYVIALLGIIAFVFEQHLTSLLATGGLFAMIIGLAIQSNIANIFSGIVVNIERPFLIGDWIKIGTMDDGEVIDITWRTLRLRTLNGCVISVPNALAAESILINYSRNRFRVDHLLHISTDYDPAMITTLANRALAATEGINAIEPADAIFVRVTTILTETANEYQIRFWAKDYNNTLSMKIKMWHSIWKMFHEAGISLKIKGHEIEEDTLRREDDIDHLVQP
jgi:potassium-dependent mechanosensitive channel